MAWPQRNHARKSTQLFGAFYIVAIFKLAAFGNDDFGYSTYTVSGTTGVAVQNGPLTLSVVDDDAVFDDENDSDYTGGETLDLSSQVLAKNFDDEYTAGQVIQSVYKWTVTNVTTGKTGVGHLLRIHTGTDPNNEGSQDGQYYRVFTIKVSKGDVLNFGSGDAVGQVAYSELHGADGTKTSPSLKQLEYFAKQTAYDENLKKGDALIGGYSVQRIVEKGQFKALLLTADDKEPVLAIRGTTGSALDWWQNADTGGVGFAEFKIAWDAKLKALVKANPGLHLTGHSQGGAQAQLVGVYATKANMKIGDIATYNSPGINFGDVNDFKYSNAGKISHFISSGDVVSMAGQKYLKGEVTHYDFDTFSANPLTMFEAHKSAYPTDPAFTSLSGFTTPPGHRDIPGNLSSSALSSASFSYLTSGGEFDREYFGFMLQIAAIGNIVGAGTLGNSVALSMATRAGSEALRFSIGAIGKAIGLIADGIEASVKIAAAVVSTLAEWYATALLWEYKTAKLVLEWTVDTMASAISLAAEVVVEMAKLSFDFWVAYTKWNIDLLVEFGKWNVEQVKLLARLGADALDALEYATVTTLKAIKKGGIAAYENVVETLEDIGEAGSKAIQAGMEQVQETQKLWNELKQIDFKARLIDHIKASSRAFDSDGDFDGKSSGKIGDYDYIATSSQKKFVIMTGVNGDTFFKGKADFNVMVGGKGDDYFRVDKGVGLIATGDGDNIVRGGKFNDVVIGGRGSDDIKGNGGNDQLFGGAGSDKIQGGAGKDLIDGGKHNDTLTGGLGADTFAFSHGRDVITDFRNDVDKIELDASALGIDGKTAKQVAKMATLSKGDAVFDFGNGNKLKIENFTNIADLADDILFA